MLDCPALPIHSRRRLDSNCRGTSSYSRLVEVRNVIGTGVGQQCDWTNIVEPHENGTKLTVEVEYTLPGAVVGKLAEHLTIRRMKRDLQSSLLNVKEMLEG